MSISGLADKTVRSIKRFFRKVWALVPISRIRVENEEEDEIPQKWVKESKESPRKIRKGQLSIKEGKIVVSSRKLHHWPWMRNIKRGMAAVLLLINFSFTQFLLIAVGGLQVVSIFFFLNCFILLDYLWKTRRAPAEE